MKGSIRIEPAQCTWRPPGYKIKIGMVEGHKWSFNVSAYGIDQISSAAVYLTPSLAERAAVCVLLQKTLNNISRSIRNNLTHYSYKWGNEKYGTQKYSSLCLKSKINRGPILKILGENSANIRPRPCKNCEKIYENIYSYIKERKDMLIHKNFCVHDMAKYHHNVRKLNYENLISEFKAEKYFDFPEIYTIEGNTVIISSLKQLRETGFGPRYTDIGGEAYYTDKVLCDWITDAIDKNFSFSSAKIIHHIK
jgi:hypothetical protein